MSAERRMAEHDQTDFEALASYTAQLKELDEENSQLETQWLRLRDLLA